MIVMIVIGVLLILFVFGFVFMGSSCNGGNCQSGGNKAQFVLFSIETCGYCQDLKPTWEKLEKEYPGVVVTVDGNQYRDLTDKFGVNGFPTIFFVPNGKNDTNGAIEYNKSSRDYKSIKEFISEYYKQ